jgi:hypothetical protein
MTQRTFFLIAAAVFSLIALGHATRLLFGWHVMVENVVVPVWISWIGLAIAGYLAYQGFRLSRTNRRACKVARLFFSV